jgi:hypothetical protein
LHFLQSIGQSKNYGRKRNLGIEITNLSLSISVAQRGKPNSILDAFVLAAKALEQELPNATRTTTFARELIGELGLPEPVGVVFYAILYFCNFYV